MSHTQLYIAITKSISRHILALLILLYISTFTFYRIMSSSYRVILLFPLNRIYSSCPCKQENLCLTFSLLYCISRKLRIHRNPSHTSTDQFLCQKEIIFFQIGKKTILKNKTGCEICFPNFVSEWTPMTDSGRASSRGTNVIIIFNIYIPFSITFSSYLSDLRSGYEN